MKHWKTLSFLPLAISLGWVVSQVQQIFISLIPNTWFKLTRARMLVYFYRVYTTWRRVKDNLSPSPLVSWCHHPRRSQDLESVSFCGELVQIKTLLMISQINCKNTKNVPFPTQHMICSSSSIFQWLLPYVGMGQKLSFRSPATSFRFFWDLR